MYLIVFHKHAEGMQSKVKKKSADVFSEDVCLYIYRYTSGDPGIKTEKKSSSVNTNGPEEKVEEILKTRG